MRILLLTLVLLAGCNQPTIKASTPRNVIVKAVPADLDKALQLAESECMKSDLHAVHVPPGKYTGLISFDCVN